MDEKDDEKRERVDRLITGAQMAAQAYIEAAQLMGFPTGETVVGGIMAAAALSLVVLKSDREKFVDLAGSLWDGMVKAARIAEERLAEGNTPANVKPLTLTEQAHVQQMFADALSKPEEGLGRA